MMWFSLQVLIIPILIIWSCKKIAHEFETAMDNSWLRLSLILLVFVSFLYKLSCCFSDVPYEIFPWASIFEIISLPSMTSSTSNLWKMYHIESALILMMICLEANFNPRKVAYVSLPFIFIVGLKACHLGTLSIGVALCVNLGALLLLIGLITWAISRQEMKFQAAIIFIVGLPLWAEVVLFISSLVISLGGMMILTSPGRGMLPL